MSCVAELSEVIDQWTKWKRRMIPRKISTVRDCWWVMAVIWCVWEERNNRVFNHKEKPTLSLLGSIANFPHFWLANAGKKVQDSISSSLTDAGAADIQVNQARANGVCIATRSDEEENGDDTVIDSAAGTVKENGEKAAALDSVMMPFLRSF